MSLKVNGTSVISDSQVLENVTGLKTVNSTAILGSGDIDTSVSEGLAVTVSTSDNSGTYTISLGASFANKHVVLLGQNIFQVKTATANGSGQITITQGSASDPQTWYAVAFS
ncbi:MAG: hypothetical protein VW683_04500 [Betaproteobacteria bacterium]